MLLAVNLPRTGEHYNNAGRSVSPKAGFEDNMYQSDWRGHSLDAPDWIAAGSCEVRHRTVFPTFTVRT